MYSNATYATPTGGNNSMAADGVFQTFVPERNILIVWIACCGLNLFSFSFLSQYATCLILSQ